MNRTKQIGLALLALLCCILATAQPAVTKGEYWFDQQFDSRQTVALTGGVLDTDLDVSDMTPGLHRLAIRTCAADGRWTAVMLKHFLIPQPASGQENTLAKYEYWLDRKFDERVTGTFSPDGIVDLDIDMSALLPGLHNISVRALDGNGHVSSVVVKHFLIPQPASGQENALAKYEYWLDRKFDERVTGTFSPDGVIDLDIDMSALLPGLHNISVRALDGNGHVSPVVVKHFLIPQKGSMMANGLTTYRYWLDRNFEDVVEGTVAEGGIIDFDVELADLTPGLHLISLQVKDEAGLYSHTLSNFFIVPEKAAPAATDKIVAYEYWFNNQPRKRVEVEAGNVVTIDADIDIVDVEPEKVIENYRFDVEKKQVIYTHDVLFGLQAFNSAGVGTKAVVDTLKNYETVIDVPFTTLSLEQENTVASPTGCLLHGYQFNCKPEDEVYWFVNAGSPHLDFYDAEGNRLTAEKKTVGDETALLVTAPTATIYVLAYGATADGAEDTIRVAQPVEIAFDDIQRVYGDENPAFTYTTARPDLLLGTPVGVTDADSTSSVGDYAITLDPTSISNSMVTVKEGTLTIGKATMTITADDIEVHQDEEMPELTWTVEGLKNGDIASEVFGILPVCQTDATPSSPVGVYVINIGGAEAENYDFVYVSGKLTVLLPAGIASLKMEVAPFDIYNLQGVKVRSKADSLRGLPKGIYIMNGRKVYIGK